jgi:hypothetical protein
MDIKQFSKLYCYPSYEEVEQILNDNIKHHAEYIDYLAEYGQVNHDCLKTIWENYDNKELIRKQGKIINDRGGFTAMQSNFYTFIAVLRHLIHSNCCFSEEAKMELWMSRKDLEVYWDGIGEWGC